MKPKIYDCFTYFNEDQLLKLRLETMWDCVDYFVICESILSFTGKKKNVNFNIDNFSKYKDKIIYLLIEEYQFKSEDPWVYEIFQRNFLLNGLKFASDNDWIIISDVDEIINPSVINNFNPRKFICGSFIQNVYLYFLNNQMYSSDKPAKWDLPKITTYKNLKNIFHTPNELRRYKSVGFFRGLKRVYVKFRTQKINNAGWHFTWMGGVEKIIDKLKNFSHQEFNTPENLIPEEIVKKIYSNNSADILNRKDVDWTLKKVSLDDHMPVYLANYPDEFSNLLLEYESNRKAIST